MLNFSRKLVGSWVFSILFVVKIKLNTSRLIWFALLISSVESLGIPICRGNRTWLPKYGNLTTMLRNMHQPRKYLMKVEDSRREDKLNKKTGNLLPDHEPHKKSVNGPYWWDYDISQKTWHCSTCSWIFHG